MKIRGAGLLIVAACRLDAATIDYATYLGGSMNEEPGGLAVDAQGYIFVGGTTGSPDFPVVNAAQGTLAGGDDAFVARFDPTGATLVYATYLGGSWQERYGDVAADRAGNVVVVGETWSADYPLRNPLQSTVAQGFITKLDPSGAIVFSTYFGDSYLEDLRAVAVDADGDIYVVGERFEHPNGSGAQYSKIARDGSGVIEGGTFFLGFGTYYSMDIAAWGRGRAAVAHSGEAGHSGMQFGYLHVVSGQGGSSFGGQDLLFGKATFSPRGNAWGAGTDLYGVAPFVYRMGWPAVQYVSAPIIEGLAIDGIARVYVIGTGTNAVVKRLDGPPYTLAIGGSGPDSGADLRVSTRGDVWAFGKTASTDFPTTPGAVQPSLAGGNDVFLVKSGCVAPCGQEIVAGEGPGPSNPNRLRAFAAGGYPLPLDFDPYGAGAFGVNVGAGDVDGGAYDEILASPGPGPTFGPTVKAFRRDGTAIAKISFWAYGTLKYGAHLAGGSIDPDPYDEIVTGAGPGAVFGPHVRGFTYDAVQLQALAKVNFFAYATLSYGVDVASGDVDADATAEISTGPGPSPAFAPLVRAFDYDGVAVSSIAHVNFWAFPTLQYGVRVASGDALGAQAGYAAAPGAGPSRPARFRGFGDDGSRVSPLPGFDATPFASLYGGRVAVGRVAGGPTFDLVASRGADPSADSAVEAMGYDGAALTPLGGFVPFGSATFGSNAQSASLGL